MESRLQYSYTVGFKPKLHSLDSSVLVLATFFLSKVRKTRKRYQGSIVDAEALI
jgi:hypothetical protein